eukprot:15367142-Ditylum_brightwellii.AAC.2
MGKQIDRDGIDLDSEGNNRASYQKIHNHNAYQEKPVASNKNYHTGSGERSRHIKCQGKPVASNKNCHAGSGE